MVDGNLAGLQLGDGPRWKDTGCAKARWHEREPQVLLLEKGNLAHSVNEGTEAPRQCNCPGYLWVAGTGKRVGQGVGGTARGRAASQLPLTRAQIAAPLSADRSLPQ